MPDEFEQQLYAWLAQIPSGRVVTYGQLAQLIGRPNGARWIGRWLGRLPAGSSLPWHRVLNASGRSSLPFEKSGSNRQLRLLQREGVLVVDGNELVGIVTSRDLRFETKLDAPVSTVMEGGATRRPAAQKARQRRPLAQSPWLPSGLNMICSGGSPRPRMKSQTIWASARSSTTR